jgi:hypothetical protein
MKMFLPCNVPSRLLALLLILFISPGISNAQPPAGQPAAKSTTDQKDQIDAQRIGFITNELSLSSEEAQVFWPVYNKYRSELNALRKSRATELLTARINFDNYSEEQINKLIDNEMNFRQRELDLTRKYNEEFKKVLPVKKVALLYRAEQQFKINLIKDARQDKAAGNPRLQKSGTSEKPVPPPDK